MAQSTTCSRCLDLMAAAWPRAITETLLAAYVAALDDLTDEELMHAAVAALKACKFFPTPAELIELAKPSSALLAWESFQRRCSPHNGRKTVTVDDPVLAHTVKSLGGWSRACYLTADELGGYYRTEWLKTYKELERRHKRHPLGPVRLLGVEGEPAVVIECGYMGKQQARIA